MAWLLLLRAAPGVIMVAHDGAPSRRYVASALRRVLTGAKATRGLVTFAVAFCQHPSNWAGCVYQVLTGTRE